MRSYTFSREGEKTLKRGFAKDEQAIGFCYDLAQSGDDLPVVCKHGKKKIATCSRGRVDKH
jgi:hypothetical protein